ncbi:MAG: TetR/AcrR family transcriptional regulator [Hamadaea sp.]|nr:TetR/AcrR family transcriptional regulator [Hamadaea sp.]NUR50413.1 TetR/AcrR family transcriptional regulator [Hamadaea sp.]NUT03192.1 TetR/AcrR family transcriptional regulator [Hamadaea sp.]
MPRADAQRNYERLLAAAETAFREHGVDAPLERIARSAGVAIGTLYGHFPNRRALLGALLRERNETLFELGDRLLTSSASEGLEQWIRAVVEHAAAYQGLAAELVGGADDEASELHASCVRMMEIGEGLTARAREAGEIRADVGGQDVFALMNAAAWLREAGSAAEADRMLGFALAGMRP